MPVQPQQQQLNYPPMVKVEDLQKTACVDPDHQKRFDLFHPEGFRERKKDYLWKTAAEETVLSSDYQKRVQAACYHNYFSTIIRWWADAVISDSPKLIGDETWDYLNEDLNEFCQKVMISALLHGHTWIRLRRREQLFDEQKQINQDQPPAVDVLDPKDVDQYQIGEDEEPLYVRTFGVVDEHPAPWQANFTRKYVWTYVDRARVAVYEAKVEVKEEGGRFVDVPAEEAIRTTLLEHDFGKVPYMLFELPPGLCLGKMLQEPALELFNHESCLSWWNLKCLRPFLTCTSPEQPSPVNAGPGLAVWIKDGKLEYCSPGSAEGEFFRVYIQYLKLQMYLLANESALAAAETKGVPQSGEAKRRDYQNVEIPLRFIGEAVRKMLVTLTKMIGEVMSWEVPLVEGMDTFDLANKDESVQNLIKMLGLSEMTLEGKNKVETVLLHESGVQDAYSMLQLTGAEGVRPEKAVRDTGEAEGGKPKEDDEDAGTKSDKPAV